MKKKIMRAALSATMAAAMVAAMAGCSLADIREDNNNGDKPETVDTVVTNTVSNSNDGNTTDDNSSKPPVVEIEPEKINYDGTYAIYCEGYSAIYVIDSYDKMVTSYDRNDFIENKNLGDEDLSGACFVGFSQGLFYFLDDNYNDLGNYTTLYAVEGETGDVAVVCHYSEGENVTAVDLYENSVLVTISSTKGKETKYSEDVYTRKEDSFEFEVEDGTQNGFLSKIKVSEIFTNSTNSAFHRYCNDSVERTINDYGFVIAEAAGKYEKISAGGNVQVFDIPYTGINIRGYDSRFVALTAYNEEYFGQYIYCYDMVTDSYYTVGNADASLLGYIDGYIYYAEDESEEYGYINNHIYKFDSESGRTEELYDLYSIPGSDEINPGVTGFCYIDDHALFVQCNSGVIGWEAVYYDECGATYKNTGCMLAESQILKYGDVSHTSITKNCPFCMTPLLNYYTEIYKVDESVARGYELINDYIAKQELNNYDTFIGDNYDVTDASDCDKHNGMVMAATVDIKVSGVDVINEKYLTVNYSRYSYSGGAHGVDSTIQYMFDIETGEYVGIADLFPESEDDFRRLVAEKTREDYIADKNGYYYDNFSGGAQGVYDSAYEAAGFEDVNIQFYRDCAYVVYGEYEMGPYASGEIMVKISYKELLGREKL